MEQFGGAAIDNAGSREEPPKGRPTPVTLDELEVCFNNLASSDVTGNDTLDELVKSNASIDKTVATLTNANSRFTKKVEALTNKSKSKKDGGGGLGPEFRNGK